MQTVAGIKLELVASDYFPLTWPLANINDPPKSLTQTLEEVQKGGSNAFRSQEGCG
jgi:hypothetical protein